MNVLALCTACLILFGSSARANPSGPSPVPASTAAADLSVAEEQAHLQTMSTHLRTQAGSGASTSPDGRPAGGSKGFNLVNVSF